MSHHQTSPTLLDRLKDTGDAAAWARFEAIYGDLIVAFCRRRGVQATDAEDVRQVATMKLMTSLKGFAYDRERGRFRDYLFRVVQSALADHATGARRATGAAPLDSALENQLAAPGTAVAGERSTQSEAGGVADAWHQEWEAFHFRRAWSAVQGQFSAQHLDVFNRLLAGDPVRRVAEMFALSEEAVHKVKQRVRDGLKGQIAAQVAEEDGV